MSRRFLFLLVGLVSIAGCRPAQTTRTAEPPPAANNETKNKATAKNSDVVPAAYHRDPNNPFQTDAYEEPEFETQIAAYSIADNFANVGNWKQLAARFDATAQQMLRDNKFVVLPADRLQMSYIYEENNYTETPRDYEIPSFITTDAVLHTFHVFFDFMLRSVESAALYDAASQMTAKLINGSVRQYNEATSPAMKEAALRNIAYLLVPGRTLGLADIRGSRIPAAARRLADDEMRLIARHETKTDSPILQSPLDYSQFVPRGHYTRSDKLKRYFVALMWYGLAPLQVRDMAGQARPGAIRQVALLGELLSANLDKPDAAGKLWTRVYEPTAFLVGIADDLTPQQFGQIVGDTDLATASNDALNKIAEEAARRNPAQIVNGARGGANAVVVRMMGQRFLPDSFVLQELVYPKVEDRNWPLGLDVMSALGSDRALDIAKSDYNQGRFPGYETQMTAMRGFLAGATPDQWQQNVYWGWMDVLRRVVAPKDSGYPSFMTRAAWTDKSLNTALGSWAELRHDTLLYAKQSGAECGEGGDDEANVPPRGYVEPDIRVYHRLRFLHNQLRQGLDKRGFLNETLKGKFTEFDDLLGFLVTVSKKELANQPLSKEEEETIRYFGDTISRLNLFTQELQTTRNGEPWSEITSETDRDMAVAADVHTNFQDQKVLQANVGHASEIWAVFPAKGKLWLGRGAVFTYYEFTQPMNDRLTDEAWQKILAGSKRPALAGWMKSFVHTENRRKVKDRVDDRYLEDTRTTGGC